MKKNKYIIALLLLSNLFTGCEIGFLDNEAFSDLTREGYYENNMDNIHALNLYKNKGFKETGTMDEDEIELSLMLS